MVTLRTLSELCGVSVAAASKALNGQQGISAEKAELVRRTAREMGYYPNAAALTLKTNRSHNIGILFHNVLVHEYFSLVLEAIRETAEAEGYDITLLGTLRGEARQGYYEHAKRRQCDGVIIVQPAYDDGEEVRRLAESELPVVGIDQVFSGRTAVMGDNAGSMEEIVRYLHDLGHKRLAFIHGEDGELTRQRIAGFYSGCRACGISVPEGYVIPARYQEPDDAGTATGKLLKLRPRPTCILYPDDVSYMGGRAEIERQGLSVPEDISCFGYDGIHLSRMLRPSLATYRQNAAEIGRQAVLQLIGEIEQPQSAVPRTVTVAGDIQPGGTVRDLTETAG